MAAWQSELTVFNCLLLRPSHWTQNCGTTFNLYHSQAGLRDQSDSLDKSTLKGKVKTKLSPSPYSLSFPLIRLNSSKHPKGQRVYFLISDAAPLNIGYSLPISGSIVNISHTEIQTSIGPWCQKDCLICQKGSEQLSTLSLKLFQVIVSMFDTLYANYET